MVSNKFGGWTIVVENRETGLRQRGRNSYPSLDDAKQAACEALLWARRHM